MAAGVSAVIHIVKITHAFDWVEWLCARHIKERRATGATVKVGALISWPCDRCPS